MLDPTKLAAIALDEHERRSASARRQVDAGRLPGHVAQRELGPWQAIAVICGAPGVLHAEVTDYRRTIVHYPGNGGPAVYGHLLSEQDARWDLACDLCPPSVWRAALAKARDAALGKATTPERVQRARNLCILARALDVPLTAASCARPVQSERKAA
ncbi:hypothetical protein GR702_13290 [Novosphingobium sp. FGD1]|uniref:Uncharacterized protein n=1 Tax=Novosphingobium silvae TaxID=2692619 RepID=A0A7X4K8W0_9SPHN|nr:hypothetical protein [Novosphingobium silvae]MYL98738.1 hypothetical protein [Novosphingobium silvae]